MKIEFNRVTWYSKLGALLLFLLVVPVLTFQIGKEYGLLLAAYDSPAIPILSVPQRSISIPTQATSASKAVVRPEL